MNTWDLCAIERAFTSAASWIAAYSVHATAVVALVWLITRMLPRRHLAAAHVLWRAALIVPLLTAWLAQSDHRDFGRWRIELALPTIHQHQPEPILPDEVPPTAPVVALNHVPSTGDEVRNPWPSFEPIARPASAHVEGMQAMPVLAALEPFAPSPNDPPVHVGGWWLLTVAALASSLLATWVWWRHHQRSERLLLGAQRLEGGPLLALTQALARHAGLEKAPELWLAPTLSSPVALGRQRIVLPTYFIEPQHLPLVRAALAHEVAHLARRDPQWYAASHLLRALFAFAPLQWLIVRELHRSMEQLCDDWAVALLGGNVELAKSLAWVASTPSPHLLPPYLTAMTMHRTSLSQRVHYILQDQAGTLPRHVGVRTLTAALALGLVITWGTPTFAVSIADHSTEFAVEPVANTKVSAPTPAPSVPSAAPSSVAPAATPAPVAKSTPATKTSTATKPATVARPVKATTPVAARPPAPPAQPLPSLASTPPTPPVAPTIDAPPVNVNVDFEMPPLPPMPPIEPLLAKLDIPNMVQTTLAHTLPVVLQETSWIAKEAAALGPKAAEVARLQQALTQANGDSKRQAELQKQLDKAQAELDRAEAALEAKAEAMEARIEAQTAKIEAWAEKFEKEMEPQIEAMAAKHAEQWEAWAEKVQAQAEKAQAQAERAQERAQNQAERAKEQAERAREHARAQVERAKEQAQRAQERAQANRSPEKGKKVKPERVKNKP